jgi:hypothetical protein
MTRERPTTFPGAVKALELLLKADGTEAETPEEATTIIRSEIDSDGNVVAKAVLRKNPVPA